MITDPATRAPQQQQHIARRMQDTPFAPLQQKP